MAFIRKKEKNGNEYWVVQHNYWDEEKQKSRVAWQKHLGPTRSMTAAEAQEKARNELQKAIEAGEITEYTEDPQENLVKRDIEVRAEESGYKKALEKNPELKEKIRPRLKKRHWNDIVNWAQDIKETIDNGEYPNLAGDTFSSEEAVERTVESVLRKGKTSKDVYRPPIKRAHLKTIAMSVKQADLTKKDLSSVKNETAMEIAKRLE